MRQAKRQTGPLRNDTTACSLQATTFLQVKMFCRRRELIREHSSVQLGKGRERNGAEGAAEVHECLGEGRDGWHPCTLYSLD